MAERAPISEDSKEVARKGEKILARIQGKCLREGYKGQYIAIEVESGKYFIGLGVLEAIDKAREEYLDKRLYVARLGYRSVESFAHPFSG